MPHSVTSEAIDLSQHCFLIAFYWTLDASHLLVISPDSTLLFAFMFEVVMLSRERQTSISSSNSVNTLFDAFMCS